MVDAAKIIFVLSMLLAFAMRRGLAEVKHPMPWVGGVLFGLIVVTGAFWLICALVYRKAPASDSEEEKSDHDPPDPDIRA